MSVLDPVAPPGLRGWLRIAIKLGGMAVLLAACVLAHYTWCALRRDRGVWPRRFLGGCAWVAGVDAHRRGEPATAPVLLLSNHVSWIDILVLAGATGTVFVAHSGLASPPLLRWLCDLNATIFIAREQRAQVGAQAEQLRAALSLARPVTLFAEGTIGDGVTLLPFKSSLLAAAEPAPEALAVQPVWLDYGPAASQIAWAGAEPGLTNFLRILARPGRLVVTLHFLPPLAEAERASRKTIATAAHARIASEMLTLI